MTSNKESIRLLKMKIKKPQNIDATVYEGEESNNEGEIKFDVEENQDEGDYNGEKENNELSEEVDAPVITIEEALPPPPELIEEGETAAEEINIYEEKIK